MSSTTKLFDEIFEELKVPEDKQDEIRARRCEIIRALNQEFRESDSKTDNSHFIGSYGRNTAIRDVSDLDMMYKLPASLYDDYRGENSSYRALSRVKNAIELRYPTTEVRVDQTVVVVQFQNFKFEIQPVFSSDDQYLRPDTYDDRWKIVNPLAERTAFRELNNETKGVARKLARLLRAWKLKFDLQMNGLLIDTLVYRFLNGINTQYSFGCDPGKIVKDFFGFLTNQPEQEYFRALGSGQLIKVKENFQAKAKQAVIDVDNAIESQGLKSERDKWKVLFGKFVPKDISAKTSCISSINHFHDTEEFIENYYEIDIRYSLKIDCRVTQAGFRTQLLSYFIRRQLWLGPKKTLDFKIDYTDVPRPFKIAWKVLNRGEEARRRDQVRGQILNDAGRGERREHTDFSGEHLVECYIIKNSIVVARDRIIVPIKVN